MYFTAAQKILGGSPRKENIIGFRFDSSVGRSDIHGKIPLTTKMKLGLELGLGLWLITLQSGQKKGVGVDYRKFSEERQQNSILF